MTTNERAVRYGVSVPAVIEAVWDAWTTPEGISTFFAPDARVELEPDGAYEILFDLSAQPGEQGAERCRVLAVQPQRMLSFSWNAPPSLPDVRWQHTSVVVRFEALSDAATHVTLSHTGWGDGGQWEDAFSYFTQAWKTVLGRLQHRFERGPVDWADPPQTVAAVEAL